MANVFLCLILMFCCVYLKSSLNNRSLLNCNLICGSKISSKKSSWEWHIILISPKGNLNGTIFLTIHNIDQLKPSLVSSPYPLVDITRLIPHTTMRLYIYLYVKVPKIEHVFSFIYIIYHHSIIYLYAYFHMMSCLTWKHIYPSTYAQIYYICEVGPKISKLVFKPY